MCGAICTTAKSLWRNWLARSAVNRKVGGSSPPRDVAISFRPIDSVFYEMKRLSLQTIGLLVERPVQIW